MINALVIMLILGAILGAILAISSNLFHVEVDKREEKVVSKLPGYNCGACGFPGCSGLAHALVNKEVTNFPCKIASVDKKAEIIDYLKNTPGPNGETVEIKA